MENDTKKVILDLSNLTNLTSIGDYAFVGCSGLTSIEIPEGVTSIAQSAFEGCRGLTSIEIPSTVTSIGISTFWGCSGLTTLRVEAENPPSLDGNVFIGVSSNLEIQVPSVSLDAYKNAEGWRDYNIVGY